MINPFGDVEKPPPVHQTKPAAISPPVILLDSPNFQ
jgi:hypothetical protein